MDKPQGAERSRPGNDLVAAVPKFCLTLEEFRRSNEGRVRTSQEMLAHFFAHDDKSSKVGRVRRAQCRRHRSRRLRDGAHARDRRAMGAAHVVVDLLAWRQALEESHRQGARDRVRSRPLRCTLVSRHHRRPRRAAERHRCFVRRPDESRPDRAAARSTTAGFSVGKLASITL